MRKIKCLFVVDRSVNMATREVEKSCDWVMSGLGKATIKYDGTPALIKDGLLYKRLNRKLKHEFVKVWKQDKKNFKYDLSMFVDLPDGAIQIENSPAEVSLHFPYWTPVTDYHGDRFFLEAFNALDNKADGTYELIGKTVQGNKYGLEGHTLVPHGKDVVIIDDYSFDGLRLFFKNLNAEGIVWHHEDGRMAKLRRSHFNFDWKSDPRNNVERRAAFKP